MRLLIRSKLLIKHLQYIRYTSSEAGHPKLNGLVAVPYTPFSDKGEIKFDVFEKLYKYLEANHFTGLFVNGTVAEGLSQSCSERKKTAEKWMDLASDKMEVTVHIGTSNLQETKELARHAESIGATAISALPPTYHKPATEEALVDYLEQVVTEAPKTPFIYYEYNITTGVYLNIPRFLELASKRIPTLCGLKHTSPELPALLNCSTVCGGKYQVLTGTTAQYLPSLSLGISDVITVPFMGTFFHDIKTAYSHADMQEAQKIQRRAQQLYNIQSKFNPGIPGSKAVFELLTGIKVGPPRLPLHGFSGAKRAELSAALQEVGFLWDVFGDSTVKFE